jgi:hypothetical protein
VSNTCLSLSHFHLPAEEENFTTSVIHYYTIGILQLPTDVTLRTYLAEKLNCDPMVSSACTQHEFFVPELNPEPLPSFLNLRSS